MQKNSVGIIGCGWLGEALAEQLITRDFSVVVTTQSTEKQRRLQQKGFVTEQLILPLENALPTLDAFAQNVVVIAITPQLRHGRTDYPDKVAQCVAMAEQGKAKQIIFISSTAIYNGLDGDVDESSELDYDADKVSILAHAEQQAVKFSGSTTILRLSGLVGSDRHPGNFLRSGRPLAQANVPVNLIHQEDVLGIISTIIENAPISGVFNGVSNTHTSKACYYQAAAKAIGLPLPEFKSSDVRDSTLGKKVLGFKVKQVLDYQFVHDDLLAWLSTTRNLKH